MARARLEQIDQERAIEEVNAHAGEVRPAGCIEAQPFQPTGLGSNPAELFGRFGLLFEVGDSTVRLDFHDAACHRLGLGNRQRRDGDGGLVFEMSANHVLEIHPVELVSRKDQHQVVIAFGEIRDIAADGIGRPLVPRLVLHRLLGGKDLDESAAERIEFVRIVNVAMQADGVELGQHENPI